MSENHLRQLIDRIADGLENNDDFDVDEALKVIDQAKVTLDSTFQKYQKACPPEAKVASEYLISSVALFYGALSNLETYTETCEDTLLAEAKIDAEQASVFLEKALDWAQSVAEKNNPIGLY